MTKPRGARKLLQDRQSQGVLLAGEGDTQLDEEIAVLDARMKLGYDLLDAVRDFWREKEAAETVTAKVAQAEKEITLYDALVKTLAPDGIPFQLIAEALELFNKKLYLASNLLFHEYEDYPLVLTRDLEVYRILPYACLRLHFLRYDKEREVLLSSQDLAGVPDELKARIEVIEAGHTFTPHPRVFLRLVRAHGSLPGHGPGSCTGGHPRPCHPGASREGSFFAFDLAENGEGFIRPSQGLGPGKRPHPGGRSGLWTCSCGLLRF